MSLSTRHIWRNEVSTLEGFLVDTAIQFLLNPLLVGRDTLQCFPPLQRNPPLLQPHLLDHGLGHTVHRIYIDKSRVAKEG